MVEIPTITRSQAAKRPAPKSRVQVLTTAGSSDDPHVKQLGKSELLSVLLHRWDTGGEVGLHHHTDGDAIWIVQQGEVSFHGEDDAVIARAEVHQAVLIPRNTAYWFENSGDEPLVMYRVSAKLGGATEGSDRVYHKPD